MFYTHLYEHIYEFDLNLTEHVNIVATALIDVRAYDVI